MSLTGGRQPLTPEDLPDIERKHVMQKTKNTAGFYPADILIPEEELLSSWCVPPVDQHTSEPEFWDSLRKDIGARPSTLDLVLPEAYLGRENEGDILRSISDHIDEYLESGLFRTFEDSLVWIEREQSTGLFRHGLLGAVDLEEYDFVPEKKARIRATEQTVPSRLPPRIRIREKAVLEFPHVLVLYNDPEGILRRSAEKTLSGSGSRPVYDFRLPACGHRIRGSVIKGEKAEGLIKILEGLISGSFLAVGDGNHSLAAAKALYERKKGDKSLTAEEVELSRYALVELVACQDEAMPFEPIHRIVSASPAEIKKEAEKLSGEYEYALPLFSGDEEDLLTVRSGKKLLPVAVLQEFLDAGKLFFKVIGYSKIGRRKCVKVFEHARCSSGGGDELEDFLPACECTVLFFVAGDFFLVQA